MATVGVYLEERWVLKYSYLKEMESKQQQEPMTYGNVFQMTGEFADKTISPRDAAAMQSAEHRAFGKTIEGGPAELMNSAAAKNVQAGLVGPDDSSGVFPREQRVAEPPVHTPMSSSTPSAAPDDERKENMTIGQELEVAATEIGDKPVDCKDAAAEMRATVNERVMHDEDKTTVAEIIGDAKSKLRGDEGGVITGSLHGDPSRTTTPGGGGGADE